MQVVQCLLEGLNLLFGQILIMFGLRKKRTQFFKFP